MNIIPLSDYDTEKVDTVWVIPHLVFCSLRSLKRILPRKAGDIFLSRLRYIQPGRSEFSLKQLQVMQSYVIHHIDCVYRPCLFVCAFSFLSIHFNWYTPTSFMSTRDVYFLYLLCVIIIRARI